MSWKFVSLFFILFVFIHFKNRERKTPGYGKGDQRSTRIKPTKYIYCLTSIQLCDDSGPEWKRSNQHFFAFAAPVFSVSFPWHWNCYDVFSLQAGPFLYYFLLYSTQKRKKKKYWRWSVIWLLAGTVDYWRWAQYSVKQDKQ